MSRHLDNSPTPVLAAPERDAKAPQPLVVTGASVAAASRVVPMDPGPELEIKPQSLKSLNSKGDTEGIIKALKADGQTISNELVEYSRESWMHPKLAAWGRENGFVSYKEELTLDTPVGHFDQLPYAGESMFGPAVPTP